MIRARTNQDGLTLLELIIGLAVGFIVTSGVIAVYANTVQNSSELLKSSKLNQEVSALLQVMTNDIRRAGYWEGIIPDAADQNPFSLTGATRLVVRDSLAGDVDQGPRGQGSCILYAYDATALAGNAPGVLEAADLFGFRLNGTVVEMRRSGVVDGADCVGGTCTSCNNGVWENVTDPDLIEITNLTFDLSASLCRNGAEPNGVDDNVDGTIDDDDEADCYVTAPAAGSGDATVETREILITVSGRLANDQSTQIRLSETVRVRNDALRRW